MRCKQVLRRRHPTQKGSPNRANRHLLLEAGPGHIDRRWVPAVENLGINSSSFLFWIIKQVIHLAMPKCGWVGYRSIQPSTTPTDDAAVRHSLPLAGPRHETQPLASEVQPPAADPSAPVTVSSLTDILSSQMIAHTSKLFERMNKLEKTWWKQHKPHHCQITINQQARSVIDTTQHHLLLCMCCLLRMTTTDLLTAAHLNHLQNLTVITTTPRQLCNNYYDPQAS